MRILLTSLFLLAALLFFSASVYVAMSRPTERITATAPPPSFEELQGLATIVAVSRVAQREASGPRLVLPSPGGEAREDKTDDLASAAKAGKRSKKPAKTPDGATGKVVAHSTMAEHSGE